MFATVACKREKKTENTNEQERNHEMIHQFWENYDSLTSGTLKYFYR